MSTTEVRTFSRRRLVQLSASGAAALALGRVLPIADAAAATRSGRVSRVGALEPGDAVTALLVALEREPLLALCERHMLQEWHDAVQRVLNNPGLSRRLDDIVVEFGNARYQRLCDRFVLEGASVPRADLVQIWRQIGDPTWNAPVYEEFYRTVRAVNRTRPADRRIRIVLGQAPITMSDVVAHPNDRTKARALASTTDAHFADVVEREVLRRGRRALLIAGKGHLLRNLSTDRGAKTPNAITRIIRASRAKPYVIDNLLLPPGASDSDSRRAARELAHAPTAVVAPLANTWLGALATSQGGGWINEFADRVLDRSDARYDHQADAVLYLGPGETLTPSQPDPAIYHWGEYPRELRQAAALAGAGDQLALAIRWATGSPDYFTLFH
jgi:hypothetical protein